jgi:nitrate reductase cytochrome c-type subunit
MKKIKLIGLLMIIASSLLFIQCTSDVLTGPDGIAGIDGSDGTDGVNGVDGVDGTAECIVCHNTETKEHAEASYLTSVHAQETMHYDSGTAQTLPTSSYANRSNCVQCHTSQGYIDNIDGKTLSTTGTIENPTYPGKQTITCTTCHDKHSTFDFANDGYDFALRQALRPVDLIATDANYTIDMGSSNTCVNCHQPRGIVPTTATVKLSSRFGPHHGPQSTLLEGIQGAEIAGALAYPGVGAAAHRTGASCTSCHMGEPSSATAHDGLHSWHPTASTCLTCHTGGAPAGVAGYDADMTTLEGLLVTKGAYSTTTGAFTSNTVDLIVAQAAWNFALLKEDRSKGIHNPNYTKALLKNSIDAIK